LFDAIVLDDKIVGLQSIHNSALLIFHQGRNQHYVRLGTESSFLRAGDAAEQRKKEQNKNERSGT